MTPWAWAAVLIVSGAAYTAMSRARNSGSLAYNAVASGLSAGVWFASQVFIVDQVVNEARSGGSGHLFFMAALYTVCTTAGSLLAHALALRLEAPRWRPSRNFYRPLDKRWFRY